MALQHLRSSTASKRPTPAAMSDGQLAINTNTASPGLFFKDSAGALIKVGPVHVGTSAPNASPASGGQTGNTVGEQWLDTTGGTYVFKVWDGSAWRSETGTFVDVNGDTMTGALGIIAGSAASPSVFFSGDTNTGVYSPGADQVAISTNGTGRLFIDASGNVGVNAQSPAARLHVVGGNAGNVLVDNDGSQFTQLLLQRNGTANTGGDLLIDGTAGKFAIRSLVGPLCFETSSPAGTNSEKLRITSAGLVGIGTSSPVSTLQTTSAVSALTSNAGFSSLPLTVTDTTALAADTGGGINFSAIVTSGGTYNSIAAIKAGREFANNADYRAYLSFYTGSNSAGYPLERLRITSTGSVGIGTTSPVQPFVVSNGGAAGLEIDPNGVDSGSTIQGYNRSTSAFVPVTMLGSHLAFRTGSSPTERFRCDSSGRLLVGTSSAPVTTNSQRQFCVETSNNYTTAVLVTNQNNANGAYLALQKSRGTTAGSITVVQSGDELGAIQFIGTDGTNPLRGADISAYVDGTPGTNDMPGRLVFSTTADGSSSLTERMRIGSDGNTRFRNCTDVYPVTDNVVRLGANGARWSQVWAANGTIQTSDQRAKTDIAVSTLGLDFIKSLRPVSYKWIEGGNVDTGERDEDGNYIYESVPGRRTHWGFIAQEVKQAFDAAGVDFGGWVLTDKDDPDSTQALRYDQFIAPLTKALQEALEKIETLEAKVAALESA